MLIRESRIQANYHDLLYQPESKLAQEYVKKRKLDNQTLQNFLIGYAGTQNQLYTYLREKGFTENEIMKSNLIYKTKNGNYLDRFRNRLIFPIQDIKNRVIKADALVRQLQYDYNHRDQSFSLSSQKEMEASAKSYFDLSIKNNINYYEYYTNKFIKENNLSFKIISDTALKEKLISFRSTRSKEMNIPAYYVFTNEELEKLVALRPKTIEDMKFSAILSPIKIKTHGEKIINIINNK